MSNRSQGLPGHRSMPAPPVAELPPQSSDEVTESLPQADALAPESRPDSSPKLSDSIKVVKVQKSGIEVIATRPGYFAQSRKVAGDRFLISDMSKFGSWMKLADAKAEAERLAKAEKEKQAKRAASV